MSTMFSGGGSSSAAAVGADAAAAAPGASATPKPVVVPGQGAGAPATPAGDPFFKETVKIDGKDVEVAYQTREELVAEIRKSRAADRRFETAAQERKAAQAERLEALNAKKEADAIRAKYGEDSLSANLDAAIESGDPERIKKARGFMEARLAQLIRQDMMDPNERAILQERKRAEAAEGKLKTHEEQQQAQALEKETGEWRQKFTDTIIGALETGQVPNTDWTASIMAKLLSINLKKGYKLSPEQLAGKTKAVMMNQTSGLLASATGEQLIELFPDLVKKVRAADLKRLRSGKPTLPGKKFLETPTPKPTDPKATQNGNQYLTPDQWREKTRARAAAAQAGQPLPEF